MILGKIKIELQRILGAFIFYTTIPFSSELSKIEDTHSSRYFSFVGVFVGIASATVYLISQLVFSLNTSPNSLGSSPISILLGMAVAVLITGALHEDGFADTFDGIFAGKKKRLKAMKDSKVGSFGVQSLFFITLIQIACLLKVQCQQFDPSRRIKFLRHMLCNSHSYMRRVALPHVTRKSAECIPHLVHQK